MGPLGDGVFLARSWKGVLMKEMTARIKENPESSLTPSTVWGHSKKIAVCELGSRPLSDTKSASTLILDFPASRTVKNTSLLFKPRSLRYFCHSSSIRLRPKVKAVFLIHRLQSPRNQCCHPGTDESDQETGELEAYWKVPSSLLLTGRLSPSPP